MDKISLSQMQALLTQFGTYVYEPIGGRSSRVVTQGTTASIGSGDDFHSFRPYREGDDVRMVDWAAFARNRELWTQQFTANRTKKLVLALDGSRSMLGVKWSKAVGLALILTAMCRRGGHDVSLYVFNRNGMFEVPQQFESAIDSIAFDWLSEFKCAHGSSLSSLHQRHKEWLGSELCILSDFLWEGVYGELEVLRAHAGASLSMLRISAPHDLSPPNGPYVDPESQERGEIDSEQLSDTRLALETFRSKLGEWSQAHGILSFDFGSLQDGQDLAEWLSQRALFAQVDPSL